MVLRGLVRLGTVGEDKIGEDVGGRSGGQEIRALGRLFSTDVMPSCHRPNLPVRHNIEHISAKIKEQ